MSEHQILSELNDIKTMLNLLLKKESDEDDMIDIKYAAQLCGLSVASLYNYISNGKMNIPYEKRGKLLWFKREDIIRWNLDRGHKVKHRGKDKIKTSLT